MIIFINSGSCLQFTPISHVDFLYAHGMIRRECPETYPNDYAGKFQS